MMATASTTGASTSAANGPGGVGNELKQDAGRLGGAAADRLSSEAEAHKGEIASQARSVSGALQKAAGELGGGDSPDWLRSSLRQGADTLQRLADSIEHKNPRELLDDLNALGRDHPGAFLGACAVAGFAAARVFKAGAAGAASGVAASGSPAALTSVPAFPSTTSTTGAPASSSSAAPYNATGAQGDDALTRALAQGAV
jgi:hypothetical protein